MYKKVPVVKLPQVEAAQLAGLPLEASVELADLAGAVKDGLLGFCADVGLMVMAQMLDAEMTARVGPKHAKIPGRTANWHGDTDGPVVLGGRKLTVTRPRGRTVEGAEVELDSWRVFSSTDLLSQLTVERMLAGIATRRHAAIGEPVGETIDAKGKATGRSSVSRRFKAATETALVELMARDLSDLEVAVIMIDGLDVAGQMVVVALVITADGTKVPVGLWLGDTENKVVVTALLADLAARGLSAQKGVMAVLDGAKALTAGVKKVLGENTPIQRCTLHKRRNVKGYLPKDLGKKIDWRLARAFAHTDAVQGLAQAKKIAAELKADHPDAAASLLEGLEEMFTVRRLGVTGPLARTLTNTNCIESMISIARTTMRNVKRWRDGEMKKRWVAVGMLEAERSFRRVRGAADMPALVAAVHRHVTGESVTPTNYDESAA